MVAVTDILLYANNVSSPLNGDVGSGDGSIVLASGQGAKYPSPTAGQYFVVTLQNLQSGAIEICHCTARSGDLLTVDRAQEGTPATAFLAAQSVVQMRVTKGMLEKLLQVRFDASDVDSYLKIDANGNVYAAAAEFQVPAGISYLDNNETHTAGKATAPIIIAASGGGTVTLDCAESNTFVVNLSSNISLTHSNAQDGQTINVMLVQDGTGTRTVTWTAGAWAWPGGAAPEVSSGVNEYDMISARYYSTAAKMCGVLLKAFA